MKVCAHPGCPTLVTKGKCAAHARQADARRGTSTERGYTYRWDVERKAFLRAYPLCGMRPGGTPPVMSLCYEERRVTPGYQVDHVQPHRGNQQLFWDKDGNWQTLCQSCGARKSQAGL